MIRQAVTWVSNFDGDKFAEQVQERNRENWDKGFHIVHINHQVTPIDMPGPILMNYSVMIVYEKYVMEEKEDLPKP